MIRWSAILAGLVVGLATHMLLTLLGVAAGLTAVDPMAQDAVGNIPVAAGIWNGLSMLVAAFVGGFIAARMCGLSRLSDGLLHGFVSWGATTLLLAYLTTTAVTGAIGSAFGFIGQSVQTIGQTVAEPGTPADVNLPDSLAAALGSLIKGTDNPGAGEITTDSLAEVQRLLRAGNRQGAIDVMVKQMGFSQERANQVATQATTLLGKATPQQARETADQAVSTLAKASWWLFFGILLSMVLGIAGGAVGVRSLRRRSHTGQGTLRAMS
ncbi:MAG: hypothetical protein H0V78_08620 [Burkholderiales bacterium]|nr:hypothetical protein [Burkholderiales bacterium]